MVFPDAATKASFESFKTHRGSDWLEYLIIQYCIKQSSPETIGEREREHRKICDSIIPQLKAAEERWGFQFVFVASGSSVNEDQSLGRIFLTDYLHNFSAERLKMSDNDLIAHVKTHAYNKVSKEHAAAAAAKRDPQHGANPDNTSSNVESEEESPSLPILAPRIKTEHTIASMPVPAVETTVGMSDTEIRNAAELLNDEEVRGRTAQLLKMTVANLSGTVTNIPLVHAWVKDWMRLGLALLGMPFSTKRFDWDKMASELAKNGVCLVNWPSGVPFPGEVPKPGGKKGIRTLEAEQIRAVARSLRRGVTGVERHVDKIEAMLACRQPVFMEAAPTTSIRDECGRRYFVDGSIDGRGLKPTPAGKSTNNLTVKHSKPKKSSEVVDQSHDCNTTPRRSTRNSTRAKSSMASASTGKGKGKQRARISDDEEDDEEIAATPTPSSRHAKARDEEEWSESDMYLDDPKPASSASRAAPSASQGVSFASPGAPSAAKSGHAVKLAGVNAAPTPPTSHAAVPVGPTPLTFAPIRPRPVKRKSGDLAPEDNHNEKRQRTAGAAAGGLSASTPHSAAAPHNPGGSASAGLSTAMLPPPPPPNALVPPSAPSFNPGVAAPAQMPPTPLLASARLPAPVPHVPNQALSNTETVRSAPNHAASPSAPPPDWSHTQHPQYHQPPQYYQQYYGQAPYYPPPNYTPHAGYPVHGGYQQQPPYPYHAPPYHAPGPHAAPTAPAPPSVNHSDGHNHSGSA